LESHSSLEDLLKLLNETEDLNHNHPFRSFLMKSQIEKGTHLVKVKDLVKLYKHITVKKAIEVCKDFLEVTYIDAIAYFSINKELVVKDYKITDISKAKFEYFLESNNLSPGDVVVYRDKLYNFYDTWCYETTKSNQFTRKDFYKMCNSFFTGEARFYKLNRQIEDFIKKGDATTWRKNRRVKKEKA
jgi:hypothetical protein